MFVGSSFIANEVIPEADVENQEGEWPVLCRQDAGHFDDPRGRAETMTLGEASILVGLAGVVSNF